MLRCMSGARCAFLLMQNPEGWQIDAGLSIPHLEEAGWQVDWVPWRDDVDWSQYQLVYPAAAWDYPEAPQLFSDTLTRIERAGARLVNSADTLRWNIDKAYLRDLEAAGAAIVPSAWFDDVESFDANNLSKNVPNITNLNLSRNNISSLAEVANLAKACTKLEFLNLHGNPVTRKFFL